ncbi:MAG: hypothetical protein KAY37_13525 [Phycisphaerae bacterium]|nr:hypothetical protein [Phycisphaerae bacterium]
MMRRNKHVVVALVVTSGMLLASAAAVADGNGALQTTIQVIALEGEQIPGEPPGAVYGQLDDGVAINSQGMAIYGDGDGIYAYHTGSGLSEALLRIDDATPPPSPYWWDGCSSPCPEYCCDYDPGCTEVFTLFGAREVKAAHGPSVGLSISDDIGGDDPYILFYAFSEAGNCQEPDWNGWGTERWYRFRYPAGPTEIIWYPQSAGCQEDIRQSVNLGRLRRDGSLVQSVYEFRCEWPCDQWFVSLAAGHGQCFIAEGGAAAPGPGGHFPVFEEEMDGHEAFWAPTRHNAPNQTLFLATVMTGPDPGDFETRLILDDNGVSCMVARDGTAANGGNPDEFVVLPSAVRKLGDVGSELCDIGNLTQHAPDVVFQAEIHEEGSYPEEGIFLWSQGLNPVCDSDVIRPLVRSDETYTCAGPFSVDGFQAPLIGGSNTDHPFVVFRASYDHGIYVYCEDFIEGHRVVPLVLHGDPLPPPYEDHWFCTFSDIDVNDEGQVIFEADIDYGGDPRGVYITTVQLADCNENGIPDQCDVGSGFSEDCNTNGIPDECDIAEGTSLDVNGNGIPDECDFPTPCPGDSNCDGVISWRDIDYFVAAMNDNVAAWIAMFLPGVPTCSFENNDVNADGTVSWRDIDPIVELMNTTCP